MTNYARWQSTITDDEGNVQPGASVEVRLESIGAPLATLYSDRTGLAPIGNPVVADADGFVYFHVTGGAYKITASFDGDVRIWRYVAIGLGAETDFTVAGTANYLAKYSSAAALGVSQIFDDGTYVGIGTASPGEKWVVSLNALAALPAAPSSTVSRFANADGSSTRVLLDAWGTGANGVLTGRAARGTAAAPTASQLDDTLLGLTAYGYGASAYSSAARAQILLRAAENWTNLAQGTYIALSTTAAGGMTTAERVRVDSAGQVGIGTTPGKFVDILAPANSNPGVRLLTGDANGYTAYGIGRTAVEGILGVAAAAGNWATNSAAGDFVLAAQGAKLHLAASGAVNFTIDTSGIVSVPGTTQASSTSTGALTTAGGIGVAKRAYVNQLTVASVGGNSWGTNTTFNQIGLYYSGTLVSAGGGGGFARLWQTDVTIQASANNADLTCLRLSPTFDVNGKTGVTRSVFYLDTVADYMLYQNQDAGKIKMVNSTASTSQTTGSIVTAGGIAALLQVWAQDFIAAGNVGVGVSAFGTSAAKVIGIGDGTKPTSAISGVQLASVSGVLKLVDGSNNTISLDTHLLRDDTSATLAKGFYETPYSNGTVSSGTLTPDAGNNNLQYYTNNGAHTLAPPSAASSILMEITNGASAGAITTSGFTKVTGDAFTTTNAHKFLCTIVKSQTYSLLNVVALQ